MSTIGAALASEITTTDAVTLVIATVGAATGILALVISQVQFHQAGPRLSVDAQWALQTGPTVMSFGRTWEGLRQTLDHAPNALPVIAIHVVNRGRSPTTVTIWGLELLIIDFTHPEYKLNEDSQLPYQLEGGGDVTFYLPARPTAQAYAGAQTLLPDVRKRYRWKRGWRRRLKPGAVAYARSVHGKVTRSHARLTLPPPEELPEDPWQMLAAAEAEATMRDVARRIGLERDS